MRPIDADVLEEILKDFEGRYKKWLFYISAKTVATVRQIVCAMKTVDAVPIVHGRWGKFGYDLRCSVCGVYQSGFYIGMTNYCPNCGAKMDGDKNG